MEGRGQERGKPVDEIAHGWNGSFFEQIAGMRSDEVERLSLHIGGTKGLESVKMVWRNHSERSRYLVPEIVVLTRIVGFLLSRPAPGPIERHAIKPGG